MARLLVRHLLCGEGLEVRPGLAGGLVSAAEYPQEGEAGLAERPAAGIAGDIVRARGQHPNMPGLTPA